MDRSRMLTELDEVLDDAGTSHTAWSPTTKLGYLAEGQEVFCEDTGFFVDRTNFSITTEVGVSEYTLDPRIIAVLGVYDGTRRLTQQHIRYLEGGDDTQLSFNYEQPNALFGYQLDAEAGTIILANPREVKTLRLRVWRYPMFSLLEDAVDELGTPASPELPVRFQRACIEWAAHKCLNHHDREQQDPVKSIDHLAAYRQYVTAGKQYLRRLKGEAVDVIPNPAYLVTP